jgi:hypothetical protein
VLFEEVAHRNVPVLGRVERLLRQLTNGNALFTRELRSAARRPVGRHCNHVEATLDEVAEIRTGAGDGYT